MLQIVMFDTWNVWIDINRCACHSFIPLYVSVYQQRQRKVTLTTTWTQFRNTKGCMGTPAVRGASVLHAGVSCILWSHQIKQPLLFLLCKKGFFPPPWFSSCTCADNIIHLLSLWRVRTCSPGHHVSALAVQHERDSVRMHVTLWLRTAGSAGAVKTFTV